jgi:3-oxoacyl-[acyl-carrier-protein] synthase-3
MGDSASALLVYPGTPDFQILSVSNLADPRFCDGFYESEESNRLFRRVYIDNLTAAMDGALKQAGLTYDDLALILPHNVNMTTWLRFSEAKGFPLERILTEQISDLGHCFSNDFALNLTYAVQNGRIAKGDYFLAVAVGLGSYYAAAVFRY